MHFDLFLIIMKSAILIFCISLLCFPVQKLMAQGTLAGCLVLSEERVYSYTSGGSLYGNNFFVDLSPDYCSWSPTSGSICNICDQPLNGGGNCPGHNYQAQGVEGIFTMLACPLDDSFLPLILILAGLGFYALLKNAPAIV